MIGTRAAAHWHLEGPPRTGTRVRTRPPLDRWGPRSLASDHLFTHSRHLSCVCSCAAVRVYICQLSAGHLTHLSSRLQFVFALSLFLPRIP